MTQFFKSSVLLFLFSFLFVGCQNTDYEKIQAEKDALALQLEEERFGAPKLLAEAQNLYESKQFALAEEKLNLLISKHPEKTEAIEGKTLLSEVWDKMKLEAEDQMWNSALTSDNLSSTEQYLTTYPDGRYLNEAKQRAKILKVQKEKSDFEYASSQNSSSVWKTFLENYPDRPDIQNIKRKIIQAEVEEIMGDSETGKIPSSQRTNYSYSSTSLVRIKNDTECELTLRYSGNDVKMIEIPAGETRSISLTSGFYKIAASACGLHYAGSEDLGGDYNASYYIVTSRY